MAAAAGTAMWDFGGIGLFSILCVGEAWVFAKDVS